MMSTSSASSRLSQTLSSFSPLTRLEMILGGSWQQGSTAAAKLSKRFILRFMQNSLCGDQGGLCFNIHADLEEMLITGLGNLHFCLILLLPAPLASPLPALLSSPVNWLSSSPGRLVGLDCKGGWGLTCSLPGLSWAPAPLGRQEEDGGQQQRRATRASGVS